MRVMVVKEQHNNVLYTVVSEDSEFRALQLVERSGGEIFAGTEIRVDDLVLVAEVPGFLIGPNFLDWDPTDSVSHIIVGLLPPSGWQPVKNYSDLVSG